MGSMYLVHPDKEKILSSNVRKGITNAKFNEENSRILFGEIAILSILIGGLSSSWWVFGAVFLGLIAALYVQKLAVILMVAFSLVWGLIGFVIGSMFDSTAASIVLSVLAFLIGFGIHMSALQWAQDVGADD